MVSNFSIWILIIGMVDQCLPVGSSQVLAAHWWLMVMMTNGCDLLRTCLPCVGVDKCFNQVIAMVDAHKKVATLLSFIFVETETLRYQVTYSNFCVHLILNLGIWLGIVWGNAFCCSPLGFCKSLGQGICKSHSEGYYFYNQICNKFDWNQIHAWTIWAVYSTKYVRKIMFWP